MSEYIFANIVRGASTTIAKGIVVHLSKMDAKEASEYQGTEPHFTYTMDTRQLPTVPNVQLVQQGDHVIDQQVIDAKTGTNRQFLVISDPQPKTLLMSWQWVAERYRGT
jgi:hypothetical protein